MPKRQMHEVGCSLNGSRMMSAKQKAHNSRYIKDKTLVGRCLSAHRNAWDPVAQRVLDAEGWPEELVLPDHSLLELV